MTGWLPISDIICLIRVARLTCEPTYTSAVSLVPSASTQHPWVSLLYQLLGNGMGVRLAIVRLDDRPGPEIRNELGHAHPGVLGGNPLPRVRQIIGRDEALRSGVADVYHRPAAGAGRVACGCLRSACSRAPRLLAGDGGACGRWLGARRPAHIADRRHDRAADTAAPRQPPGPLPPIQEAAWESLSGIRVPSPP